MPASFVFRLMIGVVALSVVSCGQATPASTPLAIHSPLINELVSDHDSIFIGVVNVLVSEREIGTYGDDGFPDPDVGPFTPVSDYAVSVERVLKADSVVGGFGIITVRINRQSSNGTVMTDVTLPETGERYLFAVDSNPDGTYSPDANGLIVLDSSPVRYHDGTDFGVKIDSDELLARITEIVTR